jgi:hypothetical protein
MKRQKKEKKRMNKQISAERIYSLGDYQNIKFNDTITEIPDEIALNPDTMERLRYLQLVDIEWSYISYMKLKLQEPKITNLETAEDALNFIEQERTITFANLLKSITKTGE